MNEHKNEEGLTLLRVKQAVEHYRDSIPIPDHDRAWEQMRGKIKADARRSRVSRWMKIGAAVVCLSFVVSIMTGTIQRTSAYTNLYSLVKKVHNGLVTMIFSDTDEIETSDALTPPPPDRNSPQASPSPHEMTVGNGTFETVSLEEARRKVAFNFRIPDYAVEGCRLQEVGIIEVGEGVYPVIRLSYSADGQPPYNITQRLVAPEELLSGTIIEETDGTIRDVAVDGMRGILIEDTNGGTKLEWLDDQVVTVISGGLSEDELLKVAQSMK